MAELVLRFEFGSRSLRAVLAAGMILSTVTELASESVTMTTYYPAPSGVYAQLITTGNTYLARDNSVNGAKVGIGTTSPQAILDVNGAVHIQATRPGVSIAAGNVLTSDANGVGSWGAAAGGFNGMSAWTTAGAFSWKAPAGVTKVMVEMWGGGGGGGSRGSGCSGVKGSDGGGGGGYAAGVAIVVPGTTYSGAVGFGGDGTIAKSNGQTGGTTSFLGMSATGGEGGWMNPGNLSAGDAPAGGVGSGGAVQFQGAQADHGAGSVGGAGGAAVKGGDGGWADNQFGGYLGAHPGGGGGGGACPGNDPGTSNLGYDGAPGAVIIYY